MGAPALSPSNFDRVVAREQTHAVKWDARREVFGSTDVLPMWVADMDFAAPEPVTQALIERARHPVYGYTLYPDALHTSLARWLRTRHDWSVEADWLIWSPGVVPALYACVRAFTQPGDGVLIQSPVYHPFFSAVTDNGRVVLDSPLRLTEAGRYGIDLDDLDAKAARASLLLLCSPHNPVGRVWQPEELRAVLAIARSHDLVVLSDEIHHDLIYPGHQHIPTARVATDPDRIITAVAPSKSFNIPGLGLSALIVADPGLRTRLQQVFGELHVGASNPFSIAAFCAAYDHGGPWLDELLSYLAETRAFALDFCSRELPGVRAIEPEGTYLIWLDCRGLGLDDATLKRFFVQDARVGPSPGIGFGVAGSGFVRLNLGTSHAVVAEALARIASALLRAR